MLAPVTQIYYFMFFVLLLPLFVFSMFIVTNKNIKTHKYKKSPNLLYGVDSM